MILYINLDVGAVAAITIVILVAMYFFRRDR